MPQNELSLYELNSLLRRVVNKSFPDRYWVRAELSEVRENLSSGHCYLEFVEKSSAGQIIAKAKGMIWSTTYRLLKPYFEGETGQAFSSGIKILVEVSMDFHELYGYSLTVHDIDPSYTLGDMARRRAEILKQLEDEGVLDMNKELEWDMLPQRIAIISSPTAAGYGDFMNQLHHNRNGYCFYTTLFHAVMQGEQAEESVIAALERIYDCADCFDGVAIIRGGGATSDLSCFDSYSLALHITQFPLPIITGIGHDRDDTVIDSVANVRVKTPTAAAEWLIDRMELADVHRQKLRDSIVLFAGQKMDNEKHNIQNMARWLPLLAERILAGERTRCLQMQHDLQNSAGKCIENGSRYLQTLAAQFPLLSERILTGKFAQLERLTISLKMQLPRYVKDEQNRLNMIEKTVELVSPERLLEKGYTLTLKNGKIVKSAQEVTSGDELCTCFADGKVKSKVIK